MQRPGREFIPFLVFAAAKLVFHTLTNGHYGFHRDELATLDDARHLAWGYVAYPPLTPALGRLELLAFGTSLAGFRFLAAAAQSVVLLLTAMMTRALGGSRAGQWIAVLAVAIAPVSLGASSLFQYVSFDFLWWVLLAFLLVRLVETGDERWWLGIGAVIGLAALTKYTIAFAVCGLAAGFFLSPLRRQLSSRWLWAGVVLAAVIVTPHLLWQWKHDFITLEFLHSIHARDVRIGRTSGFLIDQFRIAANPVTIPLWMTGLLALFGSRRLRPFRILGWMALVPFILFFAAHGRGYYMAPVYPMLLAAGAAMIPWKKASIVLAAGLLTLGSLVALLVLPLAPIDSAWGRTVMKQNPDLREEVGWPELTAEVARIWAALPPAERSRTAVFCSNYGQAGAIGLYGPAYGLPPAIAAVNSFWARGYGDPPPENLIVLGAGRERLLGRFSTVQLVGRIPNPHGLDNEESQRSEIFLCRRLRMPWPAFWRMIRSFG